MTIADDYIARVLTHLPKGTPMRTQIALELRGHIAERMEHGQTLDTVLTQLGEPAALAESYLVALPLQPAAWVPRLTAKAIDVALVISIGATIIGLGWLLLPPDMFPIAILAGLSVGGFGFLAYTIGAEAATGQTLGKRLAGLHVLRESGAPISLGQAVVRQLPVVFQVFWIDAVFALFTDRRQRAAELLSKTCVVSAHVEAPARRA